MWNASHTAAQGLPLKGEGGQTKLGMGSQESMVIGHQWPWPPRPLPHTNHTPRVKALSLSATDPQSGQKARSLGTLLYPPRPTEGMPTHVTLHFLLVSQAAPHHGMEPCKDSHSMQTKSGWLPHSSVHRCVSIPEPSRQRSGAAGQQVWVRPRRFWVETEGKWSPNPTPGSYRTSPQFLHTL